MPPKGMFATVARWVDALLSAAGGGGGVAGGQRGKKGGGAAQAETSELEKRMVAMLHKRRMSGARKRPVHLNSIALKFPKADKAFQEIRKKFDEFDKDHSQSIEIDELRECLLSLGVSVSDELVQQLFEEADMDAAPGVQFKEFILLMALLYLLNPADKESPFGLPEVEAAFELIEDAFIFFDEDGDGYLTRDEIAHALKSGREGIAGSAATQRFSEMDYNTDGQCSFKEFLYAYVGWVGTAEEDEDEEEPNQQRQQQPQQEQEKQQQQQQQQQQEQEQEQQQPKQQQEQEQERQQEQGSSGGAGERQQ